MGAVIAGSELYRSNADDGFDGRRFAGGRVAAECACGD